MNMNVQLVNSILLRISLVAGKHFSDPLNIIFNNNNNNRFQRKIIGSDISNNKITVIEKDQ